MENLNVTCSIRLFLSLVIVAALSAMTSEAVAQRGALPLLRVNDSTRTIVLNAGSHYQLEFNYRVPDLWVGNNVIMSAVPLAPNRIMISGYEPGVATLTVSDENRRMQALTVHVKPDIRNLQETMNEQLPGSVVQVQALKNGVVVRGEVPSNDEVEHALAIAENYFPGNVLNQLNVSGNQMIAINVRIYEVARSKLRQLGVDWSFFGDDVTLVQSVSGLIQQIGQGTTSGSGQTLTFGVLDDNFAFDAFIRALEQKSLAKLLDEPTLVTANGRAAEFLSGGEVPIQIATNFGGTSVEYRAFGTKLDIVPTIHGHGELTLEVRAEVSDVAGDLASADSTPGFRVRRVNTGVRMKIGHTLALAGDYREETETIVRGIPGLMDAPVLGALFRDTREQTTETELVFLITPKFIDGTESCVGPGPGQLSGPAPGYGIFHGIVEVEKPYVPNYSSLSSPYPAIQQAYPSYGTVPSNGSHISNDYSNTPVVSADQIQNQTQQNLQPQPLNAVRQGQPMPSILTDSTPRSNLRPGSVPEAQPKPVTAPPMKELPTAQPEKKLDLPNPFENRRTMPPINSSPKISGPYGFSK